MLRILFPWGKYPVSLLRILLPEPVEGRICTLRLRFVGRTSAQGICSLIPRQLGSRVIHFSNSMNESGKLNVETMERMQLQELETRYFELYNWAKDQKFVTVYRAEGDPSWSVDRSGSSQLKGTWYTERFEKIAGLKKNIEEMSGMPAKIYSLVIPKSLLDSRDSLSKGMDEVNVLNQDLLLGKKEVVQSDKEEPTLDTYLDQFDFIKKYRQLKIKYSI